MLFKHSHTSCDLLNSEIQTQLLRSHSKCHLSSASNVVYLPSQTCNLITQQKNRLRVLTRTLHVSTVILFSCPNCTKHPHSGPGQGQAGLARGNPIRPGTMLTKPTDTNCQQTLSREPYLADPWLQSHLKGVAISNCPSLCLLLFPFDFR